MKRLFILLALASPVNSAPLQCRVLGDPAFACAAEVTGGIVYVDVPQFANGFEQ